MASRVITSFFCIGVLAFSGSAFAGNKRVPLVQFVSEGYAPHKNRISSLDIAVSEEKCELLSPLPKTKAATARWAPADLYVNVQTPTDFQKAGARQGEKDIFFVGDDNNRNAKGEPYTSTIATDPTLTNSMDFENKRVTATSMSYVFRFTRTGILYETILRIDAKLAKDGCTALAYVCDRLNGTECEAGAWKQFKRAIVAVDVKGGLMDSIRAPASDKQRNDISSLRLVLSEVDDEGYPKGTPYEKVVAKK